MAELNIQEELENAAQAALLAKQGSALDAAAQAALKARGKEPRSVGAELIRQVGLTTRAVAEGAGGLFGIASDPITGLVNLALEDENKLPMLRDNISNLLTGMGVPEPEGAIERVVQATSQALIGGGGSVGIARGVGRAVTSPTAIETARQMAAQPLAQIIGGGGSGAAGQGAAEAGLGPVGQVFSSLAGGVAGAGFTPKGGGPRPTGASQAQVAVKGAEDQGIRVLTSDVFPPNTFASRWLQGIGEKLPIVGTGRNRAGQELERVAAIRDTLKDFGADYADELSDGVLKNIVGDLSQTRGAAINKYTDMKAQVFATVSDAGVVPVAKSTTTIDQEIARLTALNSREVAPIISRLEDWRGALQNQGIDNVEILRRQLGESFKTPDMAGVRSIGEQSLNRIYPALREDIGDFIKDNGSQRDFNRWRLSNARLSELVGELDNTALKATLRRGDATPETVERLLFSTKRSDVMTLYRNLSPKGRANARAAILHRAMVKSVSDDISPVKFAKEVERLGNQTGVLFGREQLQRIQGLTRALQLTERAPQAALNPPTGASLAIPVGFGVLVDTLGGFGAGLVGAASIGGAARAFESRAVRNALMAMSVAKPDSAEEARALKRVISSVAAFREDNEE